MKRYLHHFVLRRQLLENAEEAFRPEIPLLHGEELQHPETDTDLFLNTKHATQKLKVIQQIFQTNFQTELLTIVSGQSTATGNRWNKRATSGTALHWWCGRSEMWSEHHSDTKVPIRTDIHSRDAGHPPGSDSRRVFCSRSRSHCRRECSSVWWFTKIIQYFEYLNTAIARVDSLLGHRAYFPGDRDQPVDGNVHRNDFGTVLAVAKHRTDDALRAAHHQADWSV